MEDLVAQGMIAQCKSSITRQAPLDMFILIIFAIKSSSVHWKVEKVLKKLISDCLYSVVGLSKNYFNQSIQIPEPKVIDALPENISHKSLSTLAKYASSKTYSQKKNSDYNEILRKRDVCR